MKNHPTLAFIVLLFFALGCGLSERVDRASNAEPVAAPTPQTTPTIDAAPAPSRSPASADSAEEIVKTQKNFLAFGAGATIADKSSEAEFKPARKLIDEARSGEWFSAEGQTANQFVTVELAARTTLKNIVFDNNAFDYENRFAKEVTVEMSDVSAREGFQKILDATLEKDKAGQLFTVSNPVAGRWVRVSVVSNHGSPKAVNLAEIRGYGEQEPQKVFEKAGGTYLEGGYKKIHLKQEGSLITGCSEQDKKIISGTIDGRTITYVAAEPGKTQKSFGVMSLAPDGKSYVLASWDDGYSDEKLFDNLYEAVKIADAVGNCPQLPDLDGSRDAAKTGIIDSLEKTGRAVLYGINFDFDSDVIRNESRPTLDKIVALLKEKTDWSLTIEGHTDNVGGEAFNQTLSEKRAASVKNYLTAAGIDAARLNSTGLGLSKPIAPNNSEAGRAQNRRVELLKQ